MVSQILPVRTLEIYREQYGEYAGCKRLTRMSECDNISPNNFDTILSRGVMRIRVFVVDLISNSPNLQHMNCTAESKENY